MFLLEVSHFIHFADIHLAIFDFGGLRITNPLDIVIAEFRFPTWTSNPPHHPSPSAQCRVRW